MKVYYYSGLVVISLYSLVLSVQGQNCTVTQLLIDQDIACGSCLGIGDPYIYSGDCNIGINRIISRTAGMEDLALLNWNTTCWGRGDCDYDPSVDCTLPYDKCWSAYCPNKYAEQIDLLTKLNIQLVARTATFWGVENRFNDVGNNALPAVFQQLICDINAAYNHRGLRRPIVQAGIFQSATSLVNQIDISTSVLSDADISDWIKQTPEFLHYYMPDSTPNTVQYDQNRMLVNGVMDISAIETQLWFIEQAKFFIDCGYRSFHMGIWTQYTKNDTTYENFSRVCQWMRDYANSIGSFVLITGESPKIDSGSPVYNNTLVFDFDGIALRPQEVVEGDYMNEGWDNTWCNEPFDFSVFDESPCDIEPYLAILDTCKLKDEQGANGPGLMSPLGCVYETMPNSIYFDFGSGLFHAECTTNCMGCNYEILWELLDPVVPRDDISGYVSNNGNVVTHEQELTYGYEDTRWFSEKLSPQCRDFWWNYTYCDLRNTNKGFSFIRIPGMLIQKRYENYCNNACDTSLPASQNGPYADGIYMMSDEPLFVTSTMNNLTPLLPQIKIEEICDESTLEPCVSPCNGQQAGWMVFNRYVKGYKISVGNQDCSSVYTIHIQKSTGEWLGQSYGPERVFYPPSTGNYTVYVRQDNMALPPSQHGTRTVSKGIKHDIPHCCSITSCFEPDVSSDDIPIEYQLIDAKLLSLGNDYVDTVPPYDTDESIRINQLQKLTKLRNKGALRKYSIKVYPNPASSQIQVLIDTFEGEVRASVIDFKGVVVKSQKYNSEEAPLTIDVIKMPPGLYIVVIEDLHGRRLGHEQFVIMNN